MRKGDYIFPIPGTKKSKYLKENIGSVAIEFNEDELSLIDDRFNMHAAAGTRYPESMMGALNA